MVFIGAFYSNQAADLKTKLKEVTNSQWFRQYDSLANYIEVAGKDVIANKAKYTPAQWNIMQSQYDSISIAMNALITKMAGELTDRKKSKLMIQDPDVYMKSYMYDLIQLREMFKAGFLQSKTKFDREQHLLTFNPALIIPVIQGCFQLYKEIRVFVHDIRKEKFDAVNAELLAQHSVQQFNMLLNFIK